MLSACQEVVISKPSVLCFNTTEIVSCCHWWCKLSHC